MLPLFLHTHLPLSLIVSQLILFVWFDWTILGFILSMILLYRNVSKRSKGVMNFLRLLSQHRCHYTILSLVRSIDLEIQPFFLPQLSVLKTKLYLFLKHHITSDRKRCPTYWFIIGSHSFVPSIINQHDTNGEELDNTTNYINL